MNWRNRSGPGREGGSSGWASAQSRASTSGTQGGRDSEEGVGLSRARAAQTWAGRRMPSTRFDSGSAQNRGVGGDEILSAGEGTLRVDRAGFVFEKGAGEVYREILQPDEAGLGILPEVAGVRLQPVEQSGRRESRPRLGEAGLDLVSTRLRHVLNERGDHPRLGLGDRHHLPAAGATAGSAGDVSAVLLGLEHGEREDFVRQGPGQRHEVGRGFRAGGDLDFRLDRAAGQVQLDLDGQEVGRHGSAPAKRLRRLVPFSKAADPSNPSADP